MKAKLIVLILLTLSISTFGAPLLMMEFRLTAGFIPAQELSMYAPPYISIPNVELFQEFATDLVFGPLFFGGAIRVFDWIPRSASIVGGFIPDRLGYTFETGLRWQGVEVKFTHYCTHTGMPAVIQVDAMPRWEGSYDSLTLSFSGKAVILQ
jgi:hypothetical protein